jgi:hypothetical protein
LGRDYGFFNPFGSALPAGATTSVTVLNNGPVDVMPPQWLSTDFEPQNVDVRAGPQAVKLRVRLRDGFSGVSNVRGQIVANSSTLHWFNINASGSPGDTPIAGTVNDGVWGSEFVVQKMNYTGPASLWAYLMDNAGNWGDLNDGGLGPIGPQNEIMSITGGGPANPAESVWSQTNLPSFPWDPTTALNSDYDGDGLPNAVEFHLGTDAKDRRNSSNTVAVPVVTRNGGSLRLEFGLSSSNPLLGDGAVTRLVGQWSTNLQTWTNATAIAIGGGRYRVEVPAVAGKVYLRLAVVPKV